MQSRPDADSLRSATLTYLAKLANVDERERAARDLARHLGGEDLLFFTRDPEVGALLPAAGLRQTLPQGRLWQEFLRACVANQMHCGELPYPTAGSMVPATGLSSPDGSVLVLIGTHSSESSLHDIYLMMPLLNAAFQGERAAQTASSQATIAREHAEKASALTQTLDSARRELQRLLRETEIIQRQRSFLADASAKLSASLDFDATLEQVVQLVVPELADYCSIHLLQEDGAIEHVATATADAETGRKISEMREKYPADAGEGRPFSQVIQTGETLLFQTVDEQLVRAVALDREHQHALEALQIASAMLVPMIARDRILGVMTLVTMESRRHFDPEDQALVQDLASRSALAIENARLYREAMEAGRSREEFLSIASHELRTPLTTVKGYIQILLKYLQSPEGRQDRIIRAAQQLAEQAERIEVLVSDLLDATRIRQGRLELRPEQMDLREMAWRVISRFEHASERRADHKLVLDAPEPVPGYWDPFRLEQVLSNLVSNALKYSMSGGEVRVVVRRTADHAEVEVHDQGMGISPEMRANLFMPFYRDPQISPKIGGTGLGLYIAKRIVERHEGTIEVSSKPGAGSTFMVRLPLNQE